MTLLERAKANKADIYLKTAGINIFTIEKDIAAAESEISPEEKVYFIAAGKLAQFSNDRMRGFGTQNYTGTDTKGAIIVTNQKIVFVDKRLFGKQVTIIEGDRVTSVQNASGIISSRVIVKSFGDKYDITDLKKEAAEKLVVAINALIKRIKSKARQATSSVSGMEEIKKAKALLDDSIITQEEFDKIKAKYLD